MNVDKLKSASLLDKFTQLTYGPYTGRKTWIVLRNTPEMIIVDNSIKRWYCKGLSLNNTSQDKGYMYFSFQLLRLH